MDSNPLLSPAEPSAVTAEVGAVESEPTAPRSATTAVTSDDATAASSGEPAGATSITAATLGADAADADVTDEVASAPDAADAATRANTGVSHRTKPSAVAATPAVSTALRATAAATTPPPPRNWCSIYNFFIAAVVLCFVLLAAFAWWLRPALIKAWSGQRSPDYPSEAHFSTDGISSRCISNNRSRQSCAPSPPPPPLTRHSRNLAHFRSRLLTMSRPFFSVSSFLHTMRKSECGRVSTK